MIRILVYFDDKAVGARGHGRAGHRHDHVAPSGTMAGIGDNRQVTQLAHDRDG